jgi:hypothetical protein
MQLVDIELDPVNLEVFDDSVKLDTHELTYVWLSRDNLIAMLDAIDVIEDVELGLYEGYETK